MKAILASLIAVLALTAGAKADPAMWEVRDGDSAIRLFGSVHMLPADLKWRTAALENAPPLRRIAAGGALATLWLFATTWIWLFMD